MCRPAQYSPANLAKTETCPASNQLVATLSRSCLSVASAERSEQRGVSNQRIPSAPLAWTPWLLLDCLRNCTNNLGKKFQLASYSRDRLSPCDFVLGLPRLFGSCSLRLETLADLERLVLAGPQTARAIVCKSSQVMDFEKEAQSRWEDLARSAAGLCQTGHQPGRAVLLTGSTGFLGAFVAYTLAHAGFKVLCLVRATCAEQATERLRACLAFYQLAEELPNALIAIPTEGVESPHLGISRGLEAVAGKVGTIVHCAAQVSGVLPYSALCEVNVGGTQQAILTALQTGAKLVHVSTLGFVEDGHPEVSKVPTTHLHCHTGYAQSKWVAERLVWKAIESLALPAIVLRPGTVCAARSGACNIKDAVSMLLLGLVHLSCASLDARSPLPAGFNLVPVDYVAEALEPRPGTQGAFCVHRVIR